MESSPPCVEQNANQDSPKCPRCRHLRPFIEQGGEDLFIVIEFFTNPEACPTCRLISDVLTHYNIKSRYIYATIKPGGPLELTFDGDLDRRSVEIFTRPGPDNNIIPGIGHVQEVPEISSSEASLTRLHSWLTDCTRNHTRCGSHTSKPLPTRVINVGLGGDDSPFLSETLGQEGRYTALSYCWGDSRASLKTTQENLESHKVKVELSLLPQTIRDAILINRRLKIPYIWVDALCIIQGDQEDWAKEAGKMCDVYSNAYLTISASRSSHASEGCFGVQSLWGGAPHEFMYQTQAVFTRIADKGSTSFHHVPEHLSEESTEPINSRAWTLQETLLSNRTIFYTSKELVWECNEGYLCECGVNYQDLMSAGTEISTPLRKMRQPDAKFESSRVSSYPTPSTIYRLWHAIVEMYSIRHMSFPGDKLSALSGLAERFEHFLKVNDRSDQYLAGIWKHDIAEGLLWKLNPFPKDWTPEPKRPNTWRAPSWTWASLDGSIVDARSPNDVGNFKAHLKVLEIHIEPSNLSDPFGGVRSGTLVLEGPLCHGMTASRDPSADDGDFHSYKFLLRRGAEEFKFSPDDEAALSLETSVYSILHVATTSNHGGERFFLVLKRDDQVEDTDSWRRIGLAVSSLPVYPKEHRSFYDTMKEEVVRIR